MKPLLRTLGTLLGGQTANSRPVQPSAQNTFTSKLGRWYLPALAGPATFWNEIINPATIRSALQTMQRLSSDKYLEYVMSFYQAGLERFGDQWVYADINTVLLAVAKLLQPQNYLEIGVRRGRSMAMVISQVPGCAVVGFDLWIQDYAGMENPGENFVRSELNKLGHTGGAEFIAGDSKETVPRYLKDHPNTGFDLITVDGDHSVAGARLDLENVIPHMKAGGVLVFDDTANHGHRGLDKVWQELVVNDPRFAAHTFNEVGFGVGFAVRKE